MLAGEPDSKNVLQKSSWKEKKVAHKFSPTMLANEPDSMIQ